MSILYRTERWLTIAQLVRAWGYELAKGPEDREQYVQDLLHILLVDIINGRLDDSGPLMDDQRLGLRCGRLRRQSRRSRQIMAESNRETGSQQTAASGSQCGL
jgi:hypothetical protein